MRRAASLFKQETELVLYTPLRLLPYFKCYNKNLYNIDILGTVDLKFILQRYHFAVVLLITIDAWETFCVLIPALNERWLCIHSFRSVSYGRSIASSKAGFPQSIIASFRFEFPLSSLFLQVTH